MKIMSYIQKTIYAIFLLALFSGCTDEVLDGGGNGSTPPIEEGKLVDVKFVLNGTNAQTVVTKSDPDDPDDELLFLQYKDGDLCHAWYTSMDEADGFDEDDDSESDSELDGFGKQSQVTVKNVQLCSGSDYVVYVLSNYEVPKDVIDLVVYESDKNYNVEQKKYRGVVKNESTIFTKFSKIEDVKSFTISNSSGKPSGKPSGEEYMFARAYTSSEKVQEGKEKNYDYTWMLTTSGDPLGSFANSVTNKDTPVNITAETTLCASFYVPYAAVSLSIDATDLNSDVKIKLIKVSIMNCPKDYRLVNGYSLAQSKKAGSEKQIKEFYRDDDEIKTKDDDDEIETENIILIGGSKEGSKYRTVEKYKTGKDKFDEDGYFWVYENMAGILENPTHNQKLKVPANDEQYYTYIQVNAQRKDGQGSWKDITYRFILGNDNHSNCNVERNVYYNVTMSLKGDGGIGEDSWRVIYNREQGGGDDDDDDEPFIVTPTKFDLDAHATLNKIEVTFNKPGHYYIISGDGSNDLYTLTDYVSQLQNHNRIVVDGVLSSSQINENISINWGWGNSYVGFGHFQVTNNHLSKKYTLKFIQNSWFNQGGNTSNYETIAGSDKLDHKFSIVYCETPVSVDDGYAILRKSDITYVKTINVSQYPPLVVGQKSGGLIDAKSAYFVERFYENEESKTLSGLKGFLSNSTSPANFNDGGTTWVLLESDYLTNFASIDNTSNYVVVNGAPWKDLSSYKYNYLIADEYIEGKPRYRFVNDK